MGLNFDESGVVTVDQQKCVGCGQCAEICTTGLLVMQEDHPQVGAGNFMGCIACGHCVAVCPSEAITVSGRGFHLEDRAELPPRDDRAGADSFESLLRARRSVRRFTEEEVARETLDRIVTMTSTAPMGIPPHEVGIVIFSGRPKVQQFAEETVAAFKKTLGFFNPFVLVLMRLFLGKSQTDVLRNFVKPLLKMIIDYRSEGRDVFAYDAPAAMLFHHSALGDPADCTIAATYAMLAAESLGLGSCMIGTTVVLSQNKAFKKKYGIPVENKIGLALIMGHPAVKFQHSVRRRLASVQYA